MGTAALFVTGPVRRPRGLLTGLGRQPPRHPPTASPAHRGGCGPPPTRIQRGLPGDRKAKQEVAPPGHPVLPSNIPGTNDTFIRPDPTAQANEGLDKACGAGPFCPAACDHPGAVRGQRGTLGGTRRGTRRGMRRAPGATIRTTVSRLVSGHQAWPHSKVRQAGAWGGGDSGAACRHGAATALPRSRRDPLPAKKPQVGRHPMPRGYSTAHPPATGPSAPAKAPQPPSMGHTHQSGLKWDRRPDLHVPLRCRGRGPATSAPCPLGHTGGPAELPSARQGDAEAGWWPPA